MKIISESKLSVLCCYTVAVTLFSALTCCDKERVFEQNQKINDRSWSENNPLVFNVDIKDTASYYNMYINIRNADTYRFSNLYIFMTTKLPMNQIEKDTLQLVLANDEGKWLGSGLGDIFESRILFKEKIKFINSGNYQFTMQQAMRLNPLPGILDVGIRVEKVK
ncbi:MAG: gliding motility lipoprotein GldH [Bacteroidia bacterium]